MAPWVTQLISELRHQQREQAELTKHKQRMRAFHWEFLPNSNLGRKTRINSMFIRLRHRWEYQQSSLWYNDHKHLLKSPKPISKRQTKGCTWRERCICYVSVILKLKSLDIFNRHGKEAYLDLLRNCKRKLYQKNNVACSVFMSFRLAFQFYFSFVSFSLFWFF